MKKNGQNFPVTPSTIEKLQGADFTEEKIHSDPIDFVKGAEMIGQYFKHPKKLTKKYKHTNGTQEEKTLLGFRIKIEDINSLIDLGSLVDNDYIFMMFGVSENCLKHPANEEKGITVLFAGLKNIDEGCGEVVLRDSNNIPLEKPFIEYCDPCPPKCPTNLLNEINAVLPPGAKIDATEMCCCPDCVPDSPCPPLQHKQDTKINKT